MKKTLITAVVALAATASAMADAPASLSGKWTSAPVEMATRPAQSTTVVTIDFGTGEATSGICDFTAVYSLKGCQMGSKTMKVNVPVTVAGKASWVLDGSDLKLTFKADDITATADNDNLELDVPEVMKAAMQARISEFAAGITGSLEDALKDDLVANSLMLTALDIAADSASTMTATAAVDAASVPLTFTRQ